MDSNGLKFWMMSKAQHWSGLSGLEYDSQNQVLHLANQRPAPSWPPSEALAVTLLDRVPGSIDAFGMRAFLSPFESVLGTGVASDSLPLFKAAPGEKITDIVIGYDGLLYLAVAGRVTIVDLLGRADPVNATSPDNPAFSAWRLAAAPSGGVWALDRVNNQIARLAGSPLFVQPHPPYSPNTVRPCGENPDPPRLLIETKAVWPADERAVAIAGSPGGQLALLTWAKFSSDSARLRILPSIGALGDSITLTGALRPYSLTWVSETSVALMLPGVAEALVYTLDSGSTNILPEGDVYPLKDHDGGPFLHGVSLPPYYPTNSASASLVKLSLPSFARSGTADGAVLIDSGVPSTAWHRLYLEAMIPDHCEVTVRLAAVNDKTAVPSKWFLHVFGEKSSLDGETPRGAWVSATSEVPFHPGVLVCPREESRSGLFTVLIQRAGLKVRTLRGRYLKVRIELTGDGRSTPEVAGARAYASRFSYAEHYLPELYRESVFGPEAEAAADRSTPADFLERFLDNFEGILTPLEDKIADSYLVTQAESTPEEALEWLGSWIGVTFDSAYTTAQRRQLIRSAPQLFTQRGTLAGLGLALDIATNGAVSRGQIVIVEDYRMRRTFATILGANLADQEDPLLAGLEASGNSFVGDTLFLGDDHRKEFLALFADALSSDPATKVQEQAAVNAFYDCFAYRVTVLVHQEFNPQDLKLIRRVVNLETPAHVQARVVTASQSFLAGIASLVGVDTYLAPKLPRQQARVDVSYLGRDYIEGFASLDPRLSGSALPSAPPIANLTTPGLEQPGQSFKLDGSASKPSAGKQIVKYIWTQLD